MIRVTVELIPQGCEDRKRKLGELTIWNDASGSHEIGNYQGLLVAEYTDGRKGSVTAFKRHSQSVWSLIGAFLKLWGHTKHSPKNMTEEKADSPCQR